MVESNCCSTRLHKYTRSFASYTLFCSAHLIPEGCLSSSTVAALYMCAHACFLPALLTASLNEKRYTLKH